MVLQRADRLIVNDDDIQLEIALRSFTYLERAAILPELGAAIDGAGGWMLDRRQLSASSLELSVEVQVQALPEVYAALLASGLELTRDSHRLLAERCNCCMHLPRRRGPLSVLSVRVEVHFLSDPDRLVDVAPLLLAGTATA